MRARPRTPWTTWVKTTSFARNISSELNPIKKNEYHIIRLNRGLEVLAGTIGLRERKSLPAVYPIKLYLMYSRQASISGSFSITKMKTSSYMQTYGRSPLILRYMSKITSFEVTPRHHRDMEPASIWPHQLIRPMDSSTCISTEVMQRLRARSFAV